MKLTDEWFKASDISNNFIRILFLDFSKAFDFINHNVLLQKFLDYNFPPHIATYRGVHSIVTMNRDDSLKK